MHISEYDLEKMLNACRCQIAIMKQQAERLGSIDRAVEGLYIKELEKLHEKYKEKLDRENMHGMILSMRAQMIEDIDRILPKINEVAQELMNGERAIGFIKDITEVMGKIHSVLSGKYVHHDSY